MITAKIINNNYVMTSASPNSFTFKDVMVKGKNASDYRLENYHLKIKKNWNYGYLFTCHTPDNHSFCQDIVIDIINHKTNTDVPCTDYFCDLGLKTSRGKKIFESDILEFPSHDKWKEFSKGQAYRSGGDKFIVFVTDLENKEELNGINCKPYKTVKVLLKNIFNGEIYDFDEPSIQADLKKAWIAGHIIFENENEIKRRIYFKKI